MLHHPKSGTGSLIIYKDEGEPCGLTSPSSGTASEFGNFVTLQVAQAGNVIREPESKFEQWREHGDFRVVLLTGTAKSVPIARVFQCRPML